MKTKMSRLEKFWVLYDVGNSAFTLLVSTIIPIYYKNMASANGISASDSNAYLSYAISISTLIVAVLGPVLGAVADNKNRKKPLFTFFMMIVPQQRECHNHPPCRVDKKCNHHRNRAGNADRIRAEDQTEARHKRHAASDVSPRIALGGHLIHPLY